MPGSPSPSDQKNTPVVLARACVRAVTPLLSPGPLRILEPHAGRGAFVEALRTNDDLIRLTDHALNITAIEIDETCLPPRSDIPYDYRDFLLYNALTRFDLIIGNPPFSTAEEHIRHALSLPVGHSGCIVAFILRVGFLASLSRRAFWRQHSPIEIHIIRPRPSFTGDGQADNSEYALFIWKRTPTGEMVDVMPVVKWLDWKEPQDWPHPKNVVLPPKGFDMPSSLTPIEATYGVCQVCHEPVIVRAAPGHCAVCGLFTCSIECQDEHRRDTGIEPPDAREEP